MVEETFLKKKVIKEFRDQNIDVITCGHSHEAEIKWNDQILIVNPGRGYIDKFSYNPSASIVMITIDDLIKAEIKEIIA